MSRTSPSSNGRGGRSAKSLIDTMQPIIPCTTVACGAASRNWFIDPHSSASTWPNDTHRNDASGNTGDTALGHEREQSAHAGVEEHRLVTTDQVLVEAQVDLGDVGGELVDAVGDLRDTCFHQNGTS
jgi:hypothetical protein